MRWLAGMLLVVLAIGCQAPPAQVSAPSGGLWQDAHIFDAVQQTLAGSRRRLLVEMYEFGRADLADALVAARTRGADVRVVLDPTVAVSLATGRRLLKMGMPVRFYPVDDHAHQIDHVKLLVGDDQALVGGMNWGARSDRNHDYALLLRSPPELTRLAAIFEQDWSLAGGDPRPLRQAPGPVAQTAPGREIRNLIGSALATARRRIEAEIFDLTDPDLLLLLETASRRGVRVRVLLDPSQDVNRPGYSQLRRSRVEVRWYHIAPGAKLHAKAVLADASLILGSANWSIHGLDVNHELDVATLDQAAVNSYAARFEADWDLS